MAERSACGPSIAAWFRKTTSSFLKAGGRQSIVGTPKSQLRRFERQLAEQDWRVIREGLEVKLCPCFDGGSETYILGRSRDRREKEQAMHARFEKRIGEGLVRIEASCRKRAQKPGAIERRVGRLLGQNTRAAGGQHLRAEQPADIGGLLQVSHGICQHAWVLPTLPQPGARGGRRLTSS